VNHVGKTYGSVVALRDVSLEIQDGKILTIVGHSGSGKTTFLKILAGLEAPSSGEVLLDGKKATQLDLRKKATMVFQKTVVFNSSVYDNVAYGLRIRGFQKEEVYARVQQALGVVGLDSFEDRKARKLSGGEQQRVSLARALVLNPEILLLDEPTANLDPANAYIVERSVQENRRKIAQIIVIATHNLDQAKRLSDDVSHMLGGELVEKAPAKEFFLNPKDPRTKRFVAGELPI
jgi:tungstate transport system ATP-binding protein